MFEQTKALCDLFMKLGIPGLDLIVYKDGKCVFRHMDGYANPENKIPVQGNEKYHIYSCSKLVTCVAAMQLWEKGLFSLEDNLSDYLPAFREMTVKTETGIRKANNPIKIHHLFEMTSGLNYNFHTPALQAYYKSGDGRCPTVELINQLPKEPLEFEPGEGWKYGLSHDVLAALVEVLSGQKFEDYVKEYIFDPLGMEQSTFLHPLENWEGFARQFRYDPENKVYMPWWEHMCHLGREYASGGGSCVSTVEEFIKFLEALRIGDVILKKETIAMMATDRLTEKQRESYMYSTPEIGYGLGMRTPRAGKRRTEFGWSGAAGSFASVDVVNNVTIYYSQHVLRSPIMNMRFKIYDAVMADLRGEKFLLEQPESSSDNGENLVVDQAERTDTAAKAN